MFPFRRRSQPWAVVCMDPTLGPLIFGFYRTKAAADALKRKDDWLVMPKSTALLRQHLWMQDPERWRAVAAEKIEMNNLRVDLSIAQSAIANAYEPLSSSDGMDGPLFDVMARVRVALAGIGRVRPKVLASGSPSSSEFEIGMTVHDGEALLSVLPERMKS